MKFIISTIGALLIAISGYSQNIASYTAETLMQRVANEDTLYIVNFWATWCGPCVKEMPEFAKLQGFYEGKPVKILLVSLDFKDEYRTKVPSFIKKKKLQHEVIWLNETDANTFIPKIDNRWQGSIPATLVISQKNQYKNFWEGTVSAQQLKPLIDKQLAY